MGWDKMVLSRSRYRHRRVDFYEAFSFSGHGEVDKYLPREVDRWGFRGILC